MLLLLTLVVFAMGPVHTFFSPEQAALLSGRREGAGNVLAANLGVVTPFCCCSAVPLFIRLLTAGVPLGVTFSFLVAAPMVNDVARPLLLALFGWKIAVLYLGLGLPWRWPSRRSRTTRDAGTDSDRCDQHKNSRIYVPPFRSGARMHRRVWLLSALAASARRIHRRDAQALPRFPGLALRHDGERRIAGQGNGGRRAASFPAQAVVSALAISPLTGALASR